MLLLSGKRLSPIQAVQSGTSSFGEGGQKGRGGEGKKVWVEGPAC